MDYFWAGDEVEKIFRGLLMHKNNFCFLNISLFLLYLRFTFFLRTDDQTDEQTRVLIETHPELKKQCLHVTNVT